ncbi:MAG: hypothetical protein AAF840_18220, partial [Bacteroidota bacterium]
MKQQFLTLRFGYKIENGQLHLVEATPQEGSEEVAPQAHQVLHFALHQIIGAAIRRQQAGHRPGPQETAMLKALGNDYRDLMQHIYAELGSQAPAPGPAPDLEEIQTE